MLLSSSTVHGSGYLEHSTAQIRAFFAGVNTVLFIPYARPSGVSHDAYTDRTRRRFHEMGFDLQGIHEAPAPRTAVHEAEGLFVGGGNTFVLLTELYRADLIPVIRARVMEGDLPYMGSSAGSNVAGVSVGTTNDMPIVCPPTFEALALVPFNINPHYLDADPHSRHKGETREARISEFHCFNPQPVVALREGALLRVEGDRGWVEGTANARLFRRGTSPEEIQPGDRLNLLL